MNERITVRNGFLAVLASAAILIVTGALIGGLVLSIVSNMKPASPSLGVFLATVVNFISNLIASYIAWMLSRMLRGDRASTMRIAYLFLVGYTFVLLVLAVAQWVSTKLATVLGRMMHMPYSIPVLIVSIVIPVAIIIIVLALARPARA